MGTDIEYARGIAFGRLEVIGRRDGANAVCKAAYNARDMMLFAKTGKLFNFSHLTGNEHHEVLTPADAPERFKKASSLWNEVEEIETRRDSQIAFEMVLALPGEGVTLEQRIALAKSFAEKYWVSKGHAVQIDIHAPNEYEFEADDADAEDSDDDSDDEDGDSDDDDSDDEDDDEEDDDEEPTGVNWHAHLLITTRVLGPNGFYGPDGLLMNKPRDRAAEIRRFGGRACVVNGQNWGDLWREHQEEAGIRVAPLRPISEIHVGAVRMQTPGSELVESLADIRRVNHELLHKPEEVLKTLTRRNGVFSMEDLEQFLEKEFRNDTETRATVRREVLESPNLIAWDDGEASGASNWFTTMEARDRAAATRAAVRIAVGALTGRETGAVSADVVRRTVESQDLEADQKTVIEYAASAGHLKLIEEKEDAVENAVVLSAIRDAHKRDGKNVVGLTLSTNAQAQDMVADGYADAYTIEHALFKWKNGRLTWGRDTVLMMPRAQAVDTIVTGELLLAANQAGAKLILSGEDRRTGGAEHGGLFLELLRARLAESRREAPQAEERMTGVEMQPGPAVEGDARAGREAVRADPDRVLDAAAPATAATTEEPEPMQIDAETAPAAEGRPSRKRARPEEDDAAEEAAQRKHAARERALESYAAYRRERRARDLIHEWDQMFAYYRTVPPNLGHGAAYHQARAQLLSFGRLLQAEPERLEALRDYAARFGLAEQPELARILEGSRPVWAIAAITARSARARLIAQLGTAGRGRAQSSRTPSRAEMDGAGDEVATRRGQAVKEKALESYAAYRRERLARDLIHEWGQLLTRYRTPSVETADHQPGEPPSSFELSLDPDRLEELRTYAARFGMNQARERLLSFGRSLQAEPDRLEALRDYAARFDLAEQQPELARMLNDPEQAVAAMVAESEDEERGGRSGSEERSQSARLRGRDQSRTR